jgi:DNA-binding CsgD family transcriptional regulator
VRAAALTLDPQRRSARALAAAQAWHQAGGHDLAVELVEVAEAGPLGELGRAQAEWLRAQIIFVRTDGRDGTVQLLRAAQRLDPLDRDLARATYVDALRAVFLSGDMLEAGRLRALPLSQPPDATELLLHGYGLFVTEGFPHGVDILAQAIDAFVSAPVSGQENIPALETAAAAARSLWDDTGFDVLTARGVALARQAGALSLLPEALDYRALYCVDAGELAGAAAALDEAEAIRQATGMEPGFGGDSGLLAALRDEERAATGHIEQLRREPAIGGVSRRAAMLEHALAVLYNGLARYPDALAAAQRSGERYPGAGGMVHVLAELVEAAVRCHQADAAQAALQALRARTRLGGTDWGLGLEARSRALLAGGGAAEELYAEAIGRLGRTRMRLPLARAHLLYGEWLRRERRRTDARAQLRTAHDLFEAMGARSFAARARQELTATGATAHSRRNATLDELTPQEARIASLAGEGLSNPEIAARLYISKGTVDYHLNKVFRKLGIRSRAQLHHALAPLPAHS